MGTTGNPAKEASATGSLASLHDLVVAPTLPAAGNIAARYEILSLLGGRHGHGLSGP